MKSRQAKLKLIQTPEQVVKTLPNVVHDERGLAIWAGPLDAADGLSLAADGADPEPTWDPYDRPATLLRPEKGSRR